MELAVGAVSSVNTSTLLSSSSWIEKQAVGDFRVWHVTFLGLATLTCMIVLICCCVKIRIPRTKQEIEADFQRKKLTKKFRKQLKCINDDEMQEAMDLKKVLEKLQLILGNYHEDDNLENNSVGKEEEEKLTKGSENPDALKEKRLSRTFSQKMAALVRLSKINSQECTNDVYLS